MEKVAAEIKKLCEEKLRICQSILDILNKEKEIIRKMDMDSLWRLSSEKNEHATAIEALRRRIINVLKESGTASSPVATPFRLSEIILLLPWETRPELLKTASRIEKVKTEIQVTGTGNRVFINEYLSAFNEIIEIFTTGGGNRLYGKDRHYFQDNSASSFLVHREA